MKHRNGLTSIAALVAMLILLAGCSGNCGTSCSEKSGDEKLSGESAKLVGNWRNEAGFDMCFFDDGTGVGFLEIWVVHFTWRAQDGCLMVISHPQTSSPNFSLVGMYHYKLSDVTLALSTRIFTITDKNGTTQRHDGGTLTYTKVKQ